MHRGLSTNGIQAGKILIAAALLPSMGQVRNGIARLNSDGTLDTLFDSWHRRQQCRARPAIQLDGRVLAGGSFTFVKRHSPQPYRPSEPQWLGG